MKKVIVIAMMVLGLVSQARSAEPGDKGSWFGRINGGLGDITSRKYCGMNLGMEVGYVPIRGLSVGLGIGWYTSSPNKSGKFYLEGIYRPDTWDYYFRPKNKEFTAKSTKLQNSIHLHAFVGYDLLQLVGGKCRFHFTPTVGIGVAQQRLFFYKYTSKIDMVSPVDGTPFTIKGVVENEHTVRSNFEMDLGGRLDYDLSKGWSVGAYYTWYCLSQKMRCAGVSLTKSF